MAKDPTDPCNSGHSDTPTTTGSSWPNGEPQAIRDAADAKGGRK